jgi:hypothetical protein
MATAAVAVVAIVRPLDPAAPAGAAGPNKGSLKTKASRVSYQLRTSAHCNPITTLTIHILFRIELALQFDTTAIFL